MILLDSTSDFLKDTANELDTFATFIKFATIAIIAIPLVGIFLRSNKTQTLANNFKSIGNMTGLHKDDIIKLVGPPNAINAIHQGQLLQWISPGYRIAILFDSTGTFVGIQSEYSN